MQRSNMEPCWEVREEGWSLPWAGWGGHHIFIQLCGNANKMGFLCLENRLVGRLGFFHLYHTLLLMKI